MRELKISGLNKIVGNVFCENWKCERVSETDDVYNFVFDYIGEMVGIEDMFYLITIYKKSKYEHEVLIELTVKTIDDYIVYPERFDHISPYNLLTMGKFEEYLSGHLKLEQ
jgi:hypothetical protein